MCGMCCTQWWSANTRYVQIDNTVLFLVFLRWWSILGSNAVQIQNQTMRIHTKIEEYRQSEPQTDTNPHKHTHTHTNRSKVF